MFRIILLHFVFVLIRVLQDLAAMLEEFPGGEAQQILQLQTALLTPGHSLTLVYKELTVLSSYAAGRGNVNEVRQLQGIATKTFQMIKDSVTAASEILEDASKVCKSSGSGASSELLEELRHCLLLRNAEFDDVCEQVIVVWNKFIDQQIPEAAQACTDVVRVLGASTAWVSSLVDDNLSDVLPTGSPHYFVQLVRTATAAYHQAIASKKAQDDWSAAAEDDWSEDAPAHDAFYNLHGKHQHASASLVDVLEQISHAMWSQEKEDPHVWIDTFAMLQGLQALVSVIELLDSPLELAHGCHWLQVFIDASEANQLVLPWLRNSDHALKVCRLLPLLGF